jgi:hypothetical protein
MPNFALSNFSWKKSITHHLRFRYLLLLLISAVVVSVQFTNFDSARGVTLNSDSIASIYIDVPYVQASFVANKADALTENFNFDSTQILPGGYDGAQGTCPTSIAVGNISPTSDCLVYTVDPYFGGATTDSNSGPYDEGTHSTYVATHRRTPLTITFDGPKQYVGFWWSAGSYGNTATFLDSSGQVIAQLNADDIYNSVSTNSDYNGHPGERNPDAIYDQNGNIVCAAGERYDCHEPFVYVHVFAADQKSISGMQIATTGNGFEFDNLTTAESAPQPREGLVKVRDIYSALILPASPCGFGYYFQGWYSDQLFYNFIGNPGETYFPGASNLEIFGSECQSTYVAVEYNYPETGFECYIGGYWHDPNYPAPESIFGYQTISDRCEFFSLLTKPGYRLVAWNTAADGTGTTYNFGDPVDTEYLLLYPIWDLASSNLIAPDVVPVDPRASFIDFPEMTVDGSANILMCIQQSTSVGAIEEAPTIAFDVSGKGTEDTIGVASTTISGDRTAALLISGSLQDVLGTVNSSGGLRSYLSSGNFTSTKYVRIRTVPIATPTSEVTIDSCASASSSSSKTVEIRPLGLTNTLRKGTIQLK